VNRGLDKRHSPSAVSLAESGWGVVVPCWTSEAVSAREHTALANLGKETEGSDNSIGSAGSGV
jgi:hypothetical protein